MFIWIWIFCSGLLRPAAFSNVLLILYIVQRAFRARCLHFALFCQPACALANLAEGPILFLSTATGPVPLAPAEAAASTGGAKREALIRRHFLTAKLQPMENVTSFYQTTPNFFSTTTTTKTPTAQEENRSIFRGPPERVVPKPRGFSQHVGPDSISSKHSIDRQKRSLASSIRFLLCVKCI